MKDLMISDDGDLMPEIPMINGVDEVKQSVTILLKNSVGTFFADVNMGLDKTFIIDRDFEPALASDAIRDALAQDDRISIVDDIVFAPNYEQRSLNVTMLLALDGLAQKVEVVVNA